LQYTFSLRLLAGGSRGLGILLPALPVQQALRWVSLTSFPLGDVAPGSRGRNLTNKTNPRVLVGKQGRERRAVPVPFLMYLLKESSARYGNVREVKPWFIRSNIYVTLFYREVRKTSKSFHYLSKLVICGERKKVGWLMNTRRHISTKG